MGSDGRETEFGGDEVHVLERLLRGLGVGPSVIACGADFLTPHQGGLRVLDSKGKCASDGEEGVCLDLIGSSE